MQIVKQTVDRPGESIYALSIFFFCLYERIQLLILIRYFGPFIILTKQLIYSNFTSGYLVIDTLLPSGLCLTFCVITQHSNTRLLETAAQVQPWKILCFSKGFNHFTCYFTAPGRHMHILPSMLGYMLCYLPKRNVRIPKL